MKWEIIHHQNGGSGQQVQIIEGANTCAFTVKCSRMNKNRSGREMGGAGVFQGRIERWPDEQELHLTSPQLYSGQNLVCFWRERVRVGHQTVSLLELQHLCAQTTQRARVTPSSVTYSPCQKDKKMTDLTVRNLRTGS